MCVGDSQNISYYLCGLIVCVTMPFWEHFRSILPKLSTEFRISMSLCAGVKVTTSSGYNTTRNNHLHGRRAVLHNIIVLSDRTIECDVMVMSYNMMS